MSNNALYVYGIVKSGLNLKYIGKGLYGVNVYTIGEGKFSALVHDCEEKPYNSEDPNKIKELIISHNNILNIGIEDFGGVIPLHFNTIIKNSDNSSRHNLKKWLNADKERLEKIWDKVKGKKEYGIRIYYNKDKLRQKVCDSKEIKEAEVSLEGKGKGLSYLLQEKAKSKINELVQNRINKLKQRFYNNIKKITEDTNLNNSRIFINEEKDLLLSLSVLTDKQQTDKIIKILDKKRNYFSFQLAGPFAPYSFVEDEK